MIKTERSIVRIRRVGMNHSVEAVMRVALAIVSRACSGSPCFRVNQRKNTSFARRAAAMSEHIDRIEHATTNEPAPSIGLSFRLLSAKKNRPGWSDACTMVRLSRPVRRPTSGRSHWSRCLRAPIFSMYSLSNGVPHSGQRNSGNPSREYPHFGHRASSAGIMAEDVSKAETPKPPANSDRGLDTLACESRLHGSSKRLEPTSPYCPTSVRDRIRSMQPTQPQDRLEASWDPSASSPQRFIF